MRIFTATMVVVMFFATIPSLGKKPAEVPDIAKLEVTGGKLPLVIKQALAALNAKHELEIPGRGPLLETDIVVIENLQQWLIATGYIKIFPDKKDEIFHFDGFVMTKNPDGTPKALPRLPIYVRKDGNLWRTEMSPFQQILQRDFIEWAFSGLFIHEFQHVLGETRETPAYAAELRRLGSYMPLLTDRKQQSHFEDYMADIKFWYVSFKKTEAK